MKKLKTNKSFLIKTLKALSVLFLWFLVIGTIFFLSYFLYLRQSLPDPESITTRKFGESTKIFDQSGAVLLYDIHGEEKRTIIPWDQIPEIVKNTALASEDRDFYRHKGIDFRGIARALLKNLKEAGISQGGSTITQQLVKKTLLGDERTFSRKIKELILTIEIERRFDKDELFWMYLNQIPYGSNAYGIEAASRTFFSKSAKDLTLNEAAILTSLPKAPTYYSPYGSRLDELMARKNNILARMLELRFINEEDYKKALNEKIAFTPGIEKITAPHLVIMVKEYLVSKYGEEAVESNGLKITTTLDPELQKIAEEVVSKYSKINNEKYKANNAALVALNPKNGEILALVGSHDYFDIENEGNFNVATAKRQPGSAFKPFTYARAFQKGYSDASVVFDVKTEFNPHCPPDGTGKKDQFDLDCYTPENYDGFFRGPVNLRNALAQSLNVPSVKTLYLAGIEETIDLAESMGITTLKDRSRYGLSLVLGGAEVTLVDLVSAYGVFASEGIRTPWNFIKRIEAANGKVLEEPIPQLKRALEAQIARLVTDILSDNTARTPVFGFSSPLYIPGRDIAAKTGTTQENRDAWIVGFTPSLVAGVWAGNNDNQSMTRAGAGLSAAGPMWNEFMVRALQKFPVETFNKPDPVFIDKIRLTLSPLEEDPQFKNWEWSVRNYHGLPY